MVKQCSFTDCWWYEKEAEQGLPGDGGGWLHPDPAGCDPTRLSANGKPHCFLS